MPTPYNPSVTAMRASLYTREAFRPASILQTTLLVSVKQGNLYAQNQYAIEAVRKIEGMLHFGLIRNNRLKAPPPRFFPVWW